MAAGEALQSLERGDWSPRFVLMHGDLWEGNILRTPETPADAPGASRPPFVLIDWPGARVQGYPFYDLLRITRSMRIGDAILRREVSRHCRLLDTNAAGALGHLLACLGHTGLNLEYFPPEMYAELCVNCLDDLQRALAN